MNGTYNIDSVDTSGLDMTVMQAEAVGYQGDEPDETEEQDDA